MQTDEKIRGLLSDERTNTKLALEYGFGLNLIDIICH
jgi:hypothetical protein